jgi:hypothetical protein
MRNTMPISTKFQLPSLSPDRISFLRSLLKLSPEERNALLAEHCVILSQESTSESDEMEWAEEYIESEQWDTDE